MEVYSLKQIEKTFRTVQNSREDLLKSKEMFSGQVWVTQKTSKTAMLQWKFQQSNFKEKSNYIVKIVLDNTEGWLYDKFNFL